MSKGFVCDSCGKAKSGKPEVRIDVGQDLTDYQHYDICTQCSSVFKRLLKQEVD